MRDIGFKVQVAVDMFIIVLLKTISLSSILTAIPYIT